MKLTKIYTGMLVALAFSTCGTAGAQTVTTIADPAADFVEAICLIDARDNRVSRRMDVPSVRCDDRRHRG